MMATSLVSLASNCSQSFGLNFDCHFQLACGVLSVSLVLFTLDGIILKSDFHFRQSQSIYTLWWKTSAFVQRSGYFSRWCARKSLLSNLDIVDVVSSFRWLPKPLEWYLHRPSSLCTPVEAIHVCVSTRLESNLISGESLVYGKLLWLMESPRISQRWCMS